MKTGCLGKLKKALGSFCVFFLLVAFVVTCCFLLFLTTMQENLAIPLTEVHLQLAAKLTFLNILLLSLLFTIIDARRRHYTVDVPVQLILEATDQVMQGDFSIRIPEPKWKGGFAGGFDRIIHNFNAMAAELSGTETLRTDFVANVSHELKTPLAVMQNYGTMLQQPGLEEEKRVEYARIITASSRRLAELITNILKLNRLENQQIFPEFREFDLSEQLVDSMLLFEEIWERKSIELDVDIPDGVRIKSDPDLLEHIWTNLLSNAMKFTPEGGRVSLKLSTEGNIAVVAVSDTGCGMTAEQGKHIFEKFYQADGSRATVGNGLGLALVKRVVDITGGAISVQSAPGKGSTFTVRLGGVL